MTRPEKIYLEDTIVVEGEEIGHTREGLIYLIDHYETILKISTRTQLSDVHRQHIEENILKKYRKHLDLYSK